MDQKEILAILRGVGAVLTETHVVLSSGQHSDGYVNKDALLANTKETTTICWEIARRARNNGIEIVIGPAVGGAIFAHIVASYLSQLEGRPIIATYADKSGDGFVIKRGYETLIPGKKVLVVEDVLTSGSSARKVVEAVRKISGEVVALTAICNRGGVTATDIGGVPKFSSLLDLDIKSYPEKDCPLCRKGKPINTVVGHGAEFLARKSGK